VLLVGVGLIAQATLLALWARRFAVTEVTRNYRAVMRLNTFSAAALGCYLLVRLASGGR
jgi:hypothetical protein